MKIIRTLLLVSVGAFLLPSPPDSELKLAASPALVSAAMNAAGDVGGFCDRQPGVCSTAVSLAGTLEAKARYSIKLLYEWANGPQKVTGLPVPAPGPAMLMLADADSQNTLRLEDIIPEWRDPLAIRRG